MRYVVVENTPGYLPEDDDPATFSTEEDARVYASDVLSRLLDAIVDVQEDDEGFTVHGSFAQGDFSVVVYDNARPHDLGRVIEIIQEEQTRCRDCDRVEVFPPNRDRCWYCILEDALEAQGKMDDGPEDEVVLHVDAMEPDGIRAFIGVSILRTGQPGSMGEDVILTGTRVRIAELLEDQWSDDFDYVVSMVTEYASPEVI